MIGRRASELVPCALLRVVLTAAAGRGLAQRVPVRELAGPLQLSPAAAACGVQTRLLPPCCSFVDPQTSREALPLNCEAQSTAVSRAR